MEGRIEIPANYRLICDYCIHFPCTPGILAFQCINYVHERVIPDTRWEADIMSVIRLSHCTVHNNPVLHISHIPPHNENYNNNTSNGRTRRTEKDNTGES